MSVWVSAFVRSGGFSNDFGIDFTVPSPNDNKVYMSLISFSFKLTLLVLLIR